MGHTLTSWVRAPTAAGGGYTALLPGYVYVGGTATVSMSWAGLAPGQRHLGILRYLIGGSVKGQTMVEVNTNDPLPSFESVRSAPAL